MCIIKINNKVAESVGAVYIFYLREIFVDLMKVYSLYSENICFCLTQKSTNHMLKPMKSARKDILKLI